MRISAEGKAMKDELKPAIAALQSDLREIERRAAETKRAINRLCELAGAEPMFAVVDEESRPTVASLRADQFYGKVMNTAAREYLEMRQAGNLGPAAPREIFEALRDGGFKFETKIENNSISALRQVLRKNSSIFHRLDNGTYGLLAWYPNAKASKNEEEDTAPRAKAAKGRVSRTKKSQKAKADKATRPQAMDNESKAAEPNVSLVPLILKTMSDGTDWTVLRLKELAPSWKVSGLTEDIIGRKIQGTLLSLHKQGKVLNVGGGAWRKAGQKEAA
jgi:hypothetical protein